MPVKEALCAYCGRPFNFYHAPSTKPQQYCSVKCRGRAMSRARQGWKMPPPVQGSEEQTPPTAPTGDTTTA